MRAIFARRGAVFAIKGGEEIVKKEKDKKPKQINETGEPIPDMAVKKTGKIKGFK